MYRKWKFCLTLCNGNVLTKGIDGFQKAPKHLYVIYKCSPINKINIFLFFAGLASYDTILILTSILMIGLPAVHDYNKEWFRFYFYDIFPYITPLVVYPIGMIAQTGSVGCTICVTIERYVAVCLPLKARFLCTYGRAKIYVICISIFAILYNIPRFFEVTSQTYYIKDTEDNITSVRTKGYFFFTGKIGPDREVVS